MKSKYVIIMLIVGLAGCGQSPKEYAKTDAEAQSIIDETIKNYGGENFNHVKIEFDFRDKSYGSLRRDGEYIYARIFDQEKDLVHDIVSNYGFTREINGEEKNLSSGDKAKYTRSINSVIYFALLPYGLNDGAVIKQYKGEVEIEGKIYYKIFVSFKKEGGGDDHNDEFVYWIGKDDYSLDYFAYAYHTDGGGTRFRKALNKRTIGGISFQDYINYEGDNDFDHLINMDQMFSAGELKELSRIELLNIYASKISEEEFHPDALK